MKAWQLIYLAAVAVGFLIGWFTAPILAVAFIWIFIIGMETIHYFKGLQRFEEEVEKAAEELEEREESSREIEEETTREVKEA